MSEAAQAVSSAMHNARFLTDAHHLLRHSRVAVAQVCKRGHDVPAIPHVDGLTRQLRAAAERGSRRIRARWAVWLLQHTRIRTQQRGASVTRTASATLAACSSGATTGSTVAAAEEPRARARGPSGGHSDPRRRSNSRVISAVRRKSTTSVAAARAQKRRPHTARRACHQWRTPLTVAPSFPVLGDSAQQMQCTCQRRAACAVRVR
jgi:hypothetical protein